VIVCNDSADTHSTVESLPFIRIPACVGIVFMVIMDWTPGRKVIAALRNLIVYEVREIL
jgi:hypothetical protein